MSAILKVHDAVEPATKSDLREYKSEMAHDLKTLEMNLRHEFSSMKFDLLKWVLGFGIAQTSLFVVLKLFGS